MWLGSENFTRLTGNEGVGGYLRGKIRKALYVSQGRVRLDKRYPFNGITGEESV